MSDPAVVIIGAGPAGLATAAELGRKQVPAVVLERADRVGAAWRGRYDRLRLNTCRLTSKLRGAPFPKAAGMFPSRDQMVRYLEDYALQARIDVRLNTEVERLDRDNGGWTVRTAAGEQAAAHIVVATGHQHTPVIPQWPGSERFGGRLLHAADYRNADEFQNADVLVVGPGCSGMEIAHDLAEHGAGRVLLAVRTQPNIMLRQSGGLPGDLPAIASLRLPPRIADAQARLVRRLTVGDLGDYGLTPPPEGVFARNRREGKAPAIVDKDVIDAIKRRRVEIVGAVESLDNSSAVLTDGTRIAVDAVIAATGYTSGLAPIVGHLGVLDDSGLPREHGGPAAAPGLRFIGYQPGPGQIGFMGREATRVAKAIHRELSRNTR